MVVRRLLLLPSVRPHIRPLLWILGCFSLARCRLCCSGRRFTVLYFVHALYWRDGLRYMRSVSERKSCGMRFLGELLQGLFIIWGLGVVAIAWCIGVSRFRDNKHNIDDILVSSEGRGHGWHVAGFVIELLWLGQQQQKGTGWRWLRASTLLLLGVVASHDCSCFLQGGSGGRSSSRSGAKQLTQRSKVERPFVHPPRHTPCQCHVLAAACAQTPHLTAVLVLLVVVVVTQGGFMAALLWMTPCTFIALGQLNYYQQRLRAAEEEDKGTLPVVGLNSKAVESMNNAHNASGALSPTVSGGGNNGTYPYGSPAGAAAAAGDSRYAQQAHLSSLTSDIGTTPGSARVRGPSSP